MTPDEVEHRLAQVVAAHAITSTTERPFASRLEIADDLAACRETVLRTTDPDTLLLAAGELLATARRLCDHLVPAARAQARRYN
jgi:hypothetical protein